MLKTPFSILITTKNRLNDLKVTLNEISHLIEKQNVECIICDDGSNDGTYNFVKANYPNIQLLKNDTSKGLIFSRNMMMNRVTTQYAISLDDDASFITEKPLEIIENHFNKNSKCAVQAFRIFWGLEAPKKIMTNDKTCRVKGFVGCGHVWNMKAWNSIPNYLDWFVFYSEEDFAAFELFNKGWEVHYLPDVLVHHRVDIKSRKKKKDYRLRLRRSLRSGWYLYFLFYPCKLIPKKLLYTLWIQLKTKVFKGDFKALLAILQALFDVFINLPRLLKNSNRLTEEDFVAYSKLPNTKLYWASKD
jgi:glycosyltransferase involved in cell wall biosynthesis